MTGARRSNPPPTSPQPWGLVIHGAPHTHANGVTDNSCTTVLKLRDELMKGEDSFHAPHLASMQEGPYEVWRGGGVEGHEVWRGRSMEGHEVWRGGGVEGHEVWSGRGAGMGRGG